MELFVIAGAVSTALFAIANLPMIARAARTKDLHSYSLSSLAIGNAANVIHTLYVVHLPPGPIWILHAFYLVTMAFMLCLYARYAHGPRPSPLPSAPGDSTDRTVRTRT
jgi:hypothetical protein